MHTCSDRFLKKAAAVALGLLLAANCNLQSATFKSFKSSGMLCEGLSFFATEEERRTDLFFDTLEPSLSETGGVKTFSLKSEIASKQGIEPFERPLKKGRITSPFGSRIHPTFKKRMYHSGIDLAAPKGTPIFCSRPGKVSYSGWKRGYGYIIIVDHANKIQTAYAHCSKLLVKVGQAVNSGQKIGLVGRTGVATGSHLHFEIRKNGRALNPLNFVRY
ncbi:MAG: M23 family metallopeptidase [Candidatus Riflebacteria bacterium]|nr:M23 family metallopeptidase [Candidatus Riflebacteria bacterium]